MVMLPIGSALSEPIYQVNTRRFLKENLKARNHNLPCLFVILDRRYCELAERDAEELTHNIMSSTKLCNMSTNSCKTVYNYKFQVETIYK